MIQCGSVLLGPRDIELLIPILQEWFASFTEECDPPIDTGQIPIPPGSSPELRACLNAAYFDFLICYGNANSCEEKRSCRHVYEQAVAACIALYGT